MELNDEKIAALDVQGAASPMEVEGELSDMKTDKLAKKGFYMDKYILGHRYRQGWRFLNLWKEVRVEEATWEPVCVLMLPDRHLNSVFVD